MHHDNQTYIFFYFEREKVTFSFFKIFGYFIGNLKDAGQLGLKIKPKIFFTYTFRAWLVIISAKKKKTKKWVDWEI